MEKCTRIKTHPSMNARFGRNKTKTTEIRPQTGNLVKSNSRTHAHHQPAHTHTCTHWQSTLRRHIPDVLCYFVHRNVGHRAENWSERIKTYGRVASRRQRTKPQHRSTNPSLQTLAVAQPLQLLRPTCSSPPPLLHSYKHTYTHTYT